MNFPKYGPKEALRELSSAAVKNAKKLADKMDDRDNPPARRPVEDVVKLKPNFKGRPPNIILINCDDLGYGDLGAYGSKSIKTPNLDAMAESGVRFTDFHACDSVCTPSRAGMLTGRYPKRMKLDFPLHSGSATVVDKVSLRLGFALSKASVVDAPSDMGAAGLKEFEVTMASALRLRGYHTAMVGKWHLGDYATDPVYNPLNHGFDRYLGVPHSNDMEPFPLYRDKKCLEPQIQDISKLTGLYTDEAIDVIEKSKDKPFFLYLAHTYPHRPLAASKPFKGKSDGGLYGDAVEEIDWNFGRLMDAVKAQGLADNTLVIFTSDNGPWYDGSPGNLRGRKGQSFEGGFRVPFIANWPGKIPAGTVCDQLCSNLDLFPTILELTGLTLPNDRVIDGASIAKYLRKPQSPAQRREVYYYHNGELEAMRVDEWKFIRSINHYVWPMPLNAGSPLAKLSNATIGPMPMLFNMTPDMGEAYNLADRYPEKVRECQELMKAWEKKFKHNQIGADTK